MNPLVKNAETGFLEADNEWSFSSNKKKRFLQITKDYIQTFSEFPLTHKICEEVGINLRTFERHLKLDETFKDEWTEIISVLKSVYTNKLAVKANSANGIVANLAILKYLETGSFVDRMQVINSSDQLSINKRVIDAVIIDSDPEILSNSGNIDSKSSAPA